jgi:hypothetical protein
MIIFAIKLTIWAIYCDSLLDRSCQIRRYRRVAGGGEHTSGEDWQRRDET